MPASAEVGGAQQDPAAQYVHAAILAASVVQAAVARGDGMLESSAVIAFVPAGDLPRARVFYEQVLGLPAAGQDDFACVFDANGTMVRVAKVPEVSPAGYTVLGWRVTDIEAMVRGLAAKGVVFTRYDAMGQDENGIWTSPGGDKIAWFTDPDGNTLSLTQFR
jgi:predicted enzyme related to lactoylglutathione lyase